MTERRLFGRIIKGYIAVALAFTVLIGVCIYSGAYITAKKDFEASAAAEMEKNVRIIDTRLSYVHSAMQYAKNDSSVYDYAVNDYSDAIGQEVQNSLKRSVGNLSENTVNVYVSKLDSSIDRVIGATQISGIYDFMTNQFAGASSGGIKNYFKKSEGSDNTLVRYCAQSSSSRGIFIVEEESIGGCPVYIMGYVNLSSMTDTLAASGVSLAMLDDNGLICNIGADTFKSSNTINTHLKNNVFGAFTSKIIDGSVYVGAESSVYKWSYIFARTTDALTGNAVTILFYVLAICSVLLALSIFIGRFISKWVYVPVNETVKFVAQYNSDNFFDEGVFIRQSVARLSKERENLLEDMNEARLEIKAKLVGDLLNGLIGEDEIANCAKMLEIEDVYGEYRATLIRFADYESLEENFPRENIDKIKLEIEEFINDQLKNQIVYRAVMADKRTFALISFGHEVRRLREILADMAMMVQGSFDVEITGAVGCECEKLVDINQSYKSACDIMNNGFSSGSRNAIVVAEDVQELGKESFYYPLDIERELITSVVRARHDEAHKLLGEIIAENFERRRLGKERTDAFVFALTATINRIVEMLGKTTDEIFGDGKIVFLDLKMCGDTHELTKKLYELFDTIMEFVSEEEKAQQDDLSDLLLEYIHSHYNEDISLLDIGGHFNLSQCYTSTIFKEATGENFKDYLSRYRIKKAKEILEADPTIKNNDLAKMIGCNTVATLFRLFNKYEGMSPGQYVKTIKQ